MIEDTKILEELRITNSLLLQILDELQQGKRPGTSIPNNGGKGYKNKLSKEEQEALEFEIDLDWWFASYGEEILPAKYMCVSMGVPAPGTNPYNKDEGDYIFSRLLEFCEESNSEGTHVFKYMGRVWCKREKNGRNCFAFVPVKG